MPDPYLPAIMPSTGSSLALAKKGKTFSERRYVPSLVIRLEDGGKLKVPMDALANRAANQILVAKLRKVLEDQLKLIEDTKAPLDTTAIKELILALQRMLELTEKVYSSVPIIDPGSSPEASSEVGKLAAQMVESAARGMAEGNSKLAEQMKRIEELGRKRPKQVVENAPVEVKATPVP